MLGTLFLICAGVALLYFLIKAYLTGNNDFWPNQGVPLVLSHEVATLYQLLTKQKSFLEMDELYYKKFRDLGARFGGTMEFRNPVLMITDLDLVKQILVKDFDHFMDRRDVTFGKETVFSEMLVILKGQKWKDVRSVMSPAFTSGKMKRMFEHFNSCGQTFVEAIKESPDNKVIVQDIVNRFTVDVIGTTAFGMNPNTLKDKDSEFLKYANRISTISFWRVIKNLVFIFAPNVANALGLRIFDKDLMDFFIGILSSALKQREDSNEKRNDFLQLLVEARRGELKSAEGELEAFEKDAVLKDAGTGKQILFTDSLTMAQSFIFFTAGFDTVGSLVAFAAYLMAAHPDMQERIYEEVKPFMEASDGDIDYDSVSKLDYLDMFVSEILRRYPPANRLERKAVQDYQLPDSSLVIKKGSLVAVSVQGIHKDPEYYPDPLKFDPERFTPENKASRHPYTFIPFGMGPRNCIGMRFALIESKVAIAYIAYNFKIEPTEKTPIPVSIDTTVGLNRPVANLELRFTPRR